MKEDKQKSEKKRKPSKKFIYFLIILIVILAECAILYYDYTTNDESFIDEVKGYIPFLGDSNTTVINETVSTVIGKNSIGTVSLEGPYGSTDSNKTIAFILGQHPRESNAHDAIYNALKNVSDELNASYYVYKINVTTESEDFEESRMNGQLLAEEFVVPDAIEKKYDLVIDIHSSYGGYIQDPYIFAPLSTDTIAYDAANNLTNAISYVTYYEPASYSSPQYSTIPMEEGGIPSIVFEMRGNPDHSLENEAVQFIYEVDKLLL